MATFRSLKDGHGDPTYGQPRYIKASNSHLPGPWLSTSMILGGLIMPLGEDPRFQTKFRLPGEDGGEELPKNDSEVVTARARC